MAKRRDLPDNQLVNLILDAVRQKMHEGLIDIVVPGALIDFDLPDLVAGLGSRADRSAR